MADDPWGNFVMDDAPAQAAPVAIPAAAPAAAPYDASTIAGGAPAPAPVAPSSPAPQSDQWANFQMDDAPAADAGGVGYTRDANGRLIVDVPGPESEGKEPKAKPADDHPLMDIAHGIGQGARDLMGSAGQGLNLVTTPVRAAMSAMGLPVDYEADADALADKIGLPAIGKDDHVASALRRGIGLGLLTAGAAAPVAAAAVPGGVTEAVASHLAATPLVDAASAGAGEGAGEATKEAGYGPWTQLAASMIAGAGPSLAAGAGRALTAPAAADDLSSVAARLGVRPTPATVGGGVARLTQKGMGNLPGASSAVAAGTEAEIHGLADAAHEAAAGIGPVGTRQSAGDTVARGARAFERGTAAAGGRFYRARDSLMGGPEAPISLDNTRQAYADIRSQFPNSEALADLRQHPALRRLEDALPGTSLNDPDAGLLNLHEATDALSHVRGVLRNLTARNQATPAITRRVAAVEQALEDDVMNGARAADQAAGRAAGPGSAEQAQRDADAYWAQRSQTLNGALKKPISSFRDGMKVSGEQVYNGLVSDMQRKGGNLLRFRQTWTALPAHARNTFAATLLDDMGRATAGAQDAAGSQWSFNTFLTNYDNMSPGARMIAFGGRAQASTIDDIARYSARLRQIGQGANHSNTAAHGVAATFLAAIGGALMHGDVHAAAGVVGTGAASYPVARIFMATPAMRMWTRDALRGLTGSRAAQPQSTFTPLLRRLTTIAANDPAISAPVLELQRRLGDTVSRTGVPVAADRKRDSQ